MKNNGKLESVVSYIGSQKQWTQKFSYDSVGRLKEARKQRQRSVVLQTGSSNSTVSATFSKATSNPTTE
ncbi:MAG: hypothetical protein IPK58_11880 [Acidobacteria bacterium]|nr:hypothetical protein [Acidobacteriota bacterium]